MTTVVETKAVEACEAALLQHKAYNRKHGILASHDAIIDRLITRRIELVNAYRELHRQIGNTNSGLWVFFDLLLGSSSQWNPERNQEARAMRGRLEIINGSVAEKAAELADLLEERDRIHNTSGFISGTLYHPIQMIEDAAQTNYLYGTHVKEHMDNLCGRYDLKYWPSIAQCVEALAMDASRARIHASDPYTEAATRAPRNSLADYFKVLFTAIEQNGTVEHGPLPSDFRLSDASLASLANCALDLGPDEIVDAAYVKRFRQRERRKNKH